MKKFVLLCFLILIPFIGFAQKVSLITYGIDDGGVFVRWKCEYSNLYFSVYRSPFVISNSISFSNNLSFIKKLGTFFYTDLSNKDGYFYYYDTSPNIGTNYYFVLVSQGKSDILEFYPEQNYSEGFIIYLPLPKVKVDLIENLNTAIVSWDKILGVEGYIVYKFSTESYKDLSYKDLMKLQPLITLSSNETVFFDVIPSDTNFLYVVVPFTKQITNYYFSKNYNGIFLSVSKKVLESGISGDIYRDKEYGESSIPYTNFVTNVFFATNTVFITNFVSASNLKIESQNTRKSLEKNVKTYTNGKEKYFDNEYYDQNDKLKYIISKYFNKGDYITSKRMLKELLSELEDSKLKGRVMIYLARIEYSMGNKDEAINILFRAKKFLPSEADFWLSRFLVNRWFLFSSYAYVIFC